VGTLCFASPTLAEVLMCGRLITKFIGPKLIALYTGFRRMAEPTELQKSLVKEATYLRGKILTSYVQVEFLLADISVKLDLKFPYLVKDRIKAATRIAERPGFESYKNDIDKMCAELLQYDELRNIMAHGFVMLTTDKKDDHRFEFRLYQRDGRDKFNLVTIETDIPRLQLAADHITGYVSHAVAVFSRIYLEKKLEDPADATLTAK
jgi:hypothetical protein